MTQRIAHVREKHCHHHYLVTVMTKPVQSFLGCIFPEKVAAMWGKKKAVRKGREIKLGTKRVIVQYLAPGQLPHQLLRLERSCSFKLQVIL